MLITLKPMKFLLAALVLGGGGGGGTGTGTTGSGSGSGGYDPDNSSIGYTITESGGSTDVDRRRYRQL